jgi:hypothetical protein
MALRNTEGSAEHTPHCKAWPAAMEETMRTAFAMLIGAGVISFAVVDCAAPANAAVRHRHAQPRTQQSVTAPTAPAGSTNYSAMGNNPAKSYPTRHASENAVRTGTLMQNGNNPAKRYNARPASEAAMRDQTLMTNGNNPAKKAKATTASAQ